VSFAEVEDPAGLFGIATFAGQIGVDLGLIRPINYVALVAAGLISVIVLPALSLTLLRGNSSPVPASQAMPRHA
jgi:hypothetical protein